MNETSEKELNTNDKNRTLLKVALAKGNIDVVYKIVTQCFARDLTFLIQPNFNGMPFLIYLIQSGEVEHVEAFFNYCDAQHIAVNELLYQSFRGVPPIIFAIRRYELEMVKFFLTRDLCLANQYDNRQATTLHYIVRYFLRSKNSDERAYVEEFVQLAEVDLNAIDTAGNTCLHEAAGKGGHHLIDDLLKEDMDFDIDAKNNESDTAILIALRIIREKRDDVLARLAPYIKFVRKLLKAGADVGIENQDGESCFSLASEMKSEAPTEEDIDKRIEAKIKNLIKTIKRNYRIQEIGKKALGCVSKIRENAEDSTFQQICQLTNDTEEIILAFTRLCLKQELDNALDENDYEEYDILVSSSYYESPDDTSDEEDEDQDDLQIKNRLKEICKKIEEAPFVDYFFVELYNHLRQLKKGYSDPIEITNRHPTHPYERNENYFYTFLKQNGNLTFVRLTKTNETKIAHYLITTLLYEAERTDFESPTCKLHRQILSKLNKRYATFTLKKYRDFIESEEKKGDYFGELLSEDSDSEEERCYLEWPHRKQQILYSFAHTLFERSQSDKLLTKKSGTFKKRTKFTGNGLGYDLMQRQTIVREAPLSIEVQQDLNRLNAFAIKGELTEKQIKTIKTQFVVASYRGISYRRDEFGAADRRYHRKTSESSKPLFSRAILKMEGFKFYTEYLRALKQDPSLQRRMQAHANAVHDKLAQLAKSGAVNVHFLGEKPYHFNNALEAIQDLYTKNYDKFHDAMRAIIHKFIGSQEIPIEVLEDVILFSIQNEYSPFVSASDTPDHALRYAYAQKYYESYKDKRLRPRWRRDGRAERPYSGKVYVALHDPISLLNNSQHVPSLNEASAVKIDIQTVAEREMSFLGYIAEGQVVSQHVAKYPSFKGPYKNIYLEKYGLDRTLYEKFKEAIASSAPHSNERKHAKNLLTSHLVSFHEVCLIEEARLAAKKAGKILVYRNEHGGFSEYPCRITAPARSNNPEQQQAQQATRKQQTAKRTQREELAANSSSSSKRPKTSKSAASSSTGFLTHLVSQFNIYPACSEKPSLISALTFFLSASALQILDKNKQSLKWRSTDTYAIYFQRIEPYLTKIAEQQKVCIELYHPQYTGFSHSLGCSDHPKLRLYSLGGGEFAALWPGNEARPIAALPGASRYSFFSDDDIDDHADSALGRLAQDDEEEVDMFAPYSPN